MCDEIEDIDFLEDNGEPYEPMDRKRVELFVQRNKKQMSDFYR